MLQLVVIVLHESELETETIEVYHKPVNSGWSSSLAGLHSLHYSSSKDKKSRCHLLGQIIISSYITLGLEGLILKG